MENFNQLQSSGLGRASTKYQLRFTNRSSALFLFPSLSHFFFSFLSIFHPFALPLPFLPHFYSIILFHSSQPPSPTIQLSTSSSPATILFHFPLTLHFPFPHSLSVSLPFPLPTSSLIIPPLCLAPLPPSPVLSHPF